jgi:hypothetical protein
MNCVGLYTFPRLAWLCWQNASAPAVCTQRNWRKQTQLQKSVWTPRSLRRTNQHMLMVGRGTKSKWSIRLINFRRHHPDAGSPDFAVPQACTSFRPRARGFKKSIVHNWHVHSQQQRNERCSYRRQSAL